MKIDKELISRLERLSMLKLSEEEKVEVIRDLNEILQMIAKLDEIEVEGTEPFTHFGALKNRVRQDEVKDHLSRESALNNAERKNKEFFIVPKVIK